MKKSHRKDVIIARIIFAIMCIVLVVIIIGVVILVRDHKSDVAPKTDTQQTQSQVVDVIPSEVIDVPDTQADGTEDVGLTYMWTTDGVNLRSEPNTDCSVVTVLEMGTQVRMIGEEDGWVKVSYNDQEGYIRSDFLTTEP